MSSNEMTPDEFKEALDLAREVYVWVELGGWGRWMKSTKYEAKNLLMEAAVNDTAIPAWRDGRYLHIG